MKDFQIVTEDADFKEKKLHPHFPKKWKSDSKSDAVSLPIVLELMTAT